MWGGILYKQYVYTQYMQYVVSYLYNISKYMNLFVEASSACSLFEQLPTVWGG